MATVLAARREKAGNVTDGLAIRRAVQSCGTRIRDLSPTGIGRWIGAGVVEAGTLQPGGAPATHASEAGSGRPALIVGAPYVAWLRRSGRAAEATEIENELRADDRVRAANDIRRGGELRNVPVRDLLRLWAVDDLLLANLIWTLILSGAAAVLYRVVGRTESEIDRGDKALIGGTVLGCLILAGPLLAYPQTLTGEAYASVYAAISRLGARL